jgi:ABC-type transport system involved in cytochrome c biogenesis ATPase subunit
MREHLASGGLILAATHAPLSLDDAARLILGDAPATGAAA